MSIKNFFYGSDGKFKVVYLWATLFLIITASCVITEIVFQIYYFLNDMKPIVSLVTLIGLLLGMVMSLIGLYNWSKKIKNGNNHPKV